MTNVGTSIEEIARRTISIEIETLRCLLDSVDEDFTGAVRAIFGSKGRLIVTGIGKSAIVAQKVVATLNSTGTPALFMHAADAIHGDLGMMLPDDAVLCLSKSGETPEIKALVPLVKRMGNLLIGMVANRDSYLGKQARFILHTPVSQEADPNNLAPTASTTAQMALGDALATALLALRGFSPQDFAQFHPGGALGKQLYLRVSDIYPGNEKPAVSPADSIRQAIIEISSKRLGATAVLDENGLLAGIITDGDLRRMLQHNPDINALLVREVMQSSPITVLPDTLAAEAFDIMRRRSITLLIVAEGNKYLGMVHLHDLIREGLI
ncbi:MAG: KpsF/GutQ family sugar-phosphate isomerase [Saprospiraceae bacterium]|nr:KpsF/GutQ family sugar-phosphate isomerase [Saprospiraceae bacterium]